eukprot:Pgem_evm2s366
MMFFKCIVTLAFAFTVKAQQNDQGNCDLIADVAYLFDQSGSIGQNANNRNDLSLGQQRMLDMQEFVQLVNDEISIGADQAHVAFAEFNIAYTQNTDFTSNRAYDEAALTTELFKLKYTTAENQPNMRTHLGAALRQMDSGMFASRTRKDVPKIIVTLTDGNANDPYPNDKVTKVAPELRNKGYTILAVAIGNVKQEGLMDLTDNADNIFRVDDFSKLHEKIKDLSKALCSVNCQVSEWSEWSMCNFGGDTCGTGEQSRARTITKEAEYKGAQCPDLNESQPCSKACCEATEWSEWGECVIDVANLNNNKTCGENIGAQTRSNKDSNCVETAESQSCSIVCPPVVEPTPTPVAEQPQPDPVQEQSPPKDNTAAIAGGVVGGVAALAGIAGAAYAYKRHVDSKTPSFEEFNLETPGDNNPLFNSDTTITANRIIICKIKTYSKY